jgi:hypothetical protein
MYAAAIGIVIVAIIIVIFMVARASPRVCSSKYTFMPKYGATGQKNLIAIDFTTNEAAQALCNTMDACKGYVVKQKRAYMKSGVANPDAQNAIMTEPDDGLYARVVTCN